MNDLLFFRQIYCSHVCKVHQDVILILPILTLCLIELFLLRIFRDLIQSISYYFYKFANLIIGKILIRMPFDGDIRVLDYFIRLLYLTKI